MSKRALLVVGLALALTGIVRTGWSQDPPAMSTQLTVEVKPGANLQFEEFIRAFRDGAERTGSSLYWLTSQNEVGDGNTYTFTRQFGDWSEFEEPANAFMAEAYDEEELARLLGLYYDSVESVSTVGYAVRPDLSRQGGPQITDPAAVIYIDIQARPGMAPQLEGIMRRVIEATDTADPDTYWLTMAATFGVGGSYRLVVVIDDWEDLNDPAAPVVDRLIAHFGAAQGAMLNQAAANAIESIEQKLRRVRTDLARQPD